jgi:hypothetical protein
VACTHSRRGFYRHPFRSGTGFHIAELCRDCSVNVRGVGVWVPRSEVRDSDSLPISPGYKPPTRQPSLFDALDGEEASHG